jgi:fermentation-respiration switch protein FrsA (DUF1100 family)
VTWLLIAGVTACASGPSRPVFEERQISLQRGFITGVLKIPVLPRGPKPAILRPMVSHDLLLARGIVVVQFQTNWQMLASLARPESELEGGVPPAAVPGSQAESESPTVGRWLLAAPRAGLVGRDYFNYIAVEASKIVPEVLDHLESVPEVDPRRIAIGGSSTTGFVALEALVQEPRLSAAAIRVACGDYHAFLRESSLALDGEPRWLVDGKLVLDDDYEAGLREREPVRFADRLPPRPLLLLNGALDRAVPVACARETARAFGDAYARHGETDRFRFVLYEDRPHDLGQDADREILAWWEHWLLNP